MTFSSTKGRSSSTKGYSQKGMIMVAGAVKLAYYFMKHEDSLLLLFLSRYPFDRGYILMFHSESSTYRTALNGTKYA
jgi:hypothetical protein